MYVHCNHSRLLLPLVLDCIPHQCCCLLPPHFNKERIQNYGCQCLFYYILLHLPLGTFQLIFLQCFLLILFQGFSWSMTEPHRIQYDIHAINMAFQGCSSSSKEKAIFKITQLEPSISNLGICTKNSSSLLFEDDILFV